MMYRALIATLVVLTIAGCSSMQTASRQDTVDREYMARVQQQADRYGTQVFWVHLPQKRVTATQ